MDEALCIEVGTEAFFPVQDESDMVRAAQRICHRCPVMSECREYALTFTILDGIWGGTTVQGRARIKRERRRNDSGRQDR